MSAPKFAVKSWVTVDGISAGIVENCEYEGGRYWYDVRWNIWDMSPVRYKETELALYTEESEDSNGKED